MSFLPAEHDNAMDLQAVLSFIDSLEFAHNAESSDSGASTSSTSSCRSTASNKNYHGTAIDKLLHQRADTIKEHKKRERKSKRQRRTLSSSSRLEQNRRAELLFLRRRAQELEEHMEQLKKRKTSGVSCKIDNLSGESWTEFAKTQYRARLQAEESNQKLKAMLTSQVKVADTLRGIVRNAVSVLTSLETTKLRSEISVMEDAMPAELTM